MDALQKEIQDDAKRRSDEIEAKARREAAAIVKEAKARADAADEAFERELKDEIGRLSLEYRSSREMQERNLLLAAREKTIDGLVERRRGSVIKRVKEKGYGRLFDSAIKEALKVSPMESLTLVMDKRDAKFAKGFAGKIRHSQGKMDGLVIYAADGRIKIDATLDTLFDRNRDTVKEALRKGVFGTGKRGIAKKKFGKGAAKKKVPKNASRKTALKHKPKRKRK